MMSSIYSKSDTFYCTVLCACDIKTWTTAPVGKTYSATGIKSVQYCSTYLTAMYNEIGADKLYGDTSGSNYTAQEKSDYAAANPDKPGLPDNKNVVKLQTFMNYLGMIESKYACSGICQKMDIYYFSDISNGTPTGAC